nr:MAG TPA: Alginate and motility regulator [Caudoviricetes sp.]
MNTCIILCNYYMFTCIRFTCYHIREKGGVIMYQGFTDAKKKANSKYLKNTVETIAFRVPKGEKEKIKDIAEKAGLSLNSFINNAVKEKIDRFTSSE